ncbi:hypothetical protein ES702_02736 [subsurface metagenome]
MARRELGYELMLDELNASNADEGKIRNARWTGYEMKDGYCFWRKVVDGFYINRGIWQVSYTSLWLRNESLG